MEEGEVAGHALGGAGVEDDERVGGRDGVGDPAVESMREVARFGVERGRLLVLGLLLGGRVGDVSRGGGGARGVVGLATRGARLELLLLLLGVGVGALVDPVKLAASLDPAGLGSIKVQRAGGELDQNGLNDRKS